MPEFLGRGRRFRESSDYFTPYSLLRTTEEMLGISTYLGAAAKAHGMRAALYL